VKSRIKIALVGYGKIARDQHAPALGASADFELAACATHGEPARNVPSFRDVDEMLLAVPGLECVAICTPPQARFAAARTALAAGCHVLLEKPPAVETAEVEALVRTARARSLALFAAWHSRHAPAVEPARRRLAGRRVRRITIVWKENVREWHPGQSWIWQPGGLGVFDPGINALSIVTALMPGPFEVVSAELAFPANCETPIAARVGLRAGADIGIDADFDWREPGEPRWDIRVETDDGEVALSRGGASLHIAGTAVELGPQREYPSLYERFAALVRARGIDADAEPLRLANAALAAGRRRTVAPFIE